MSNVLSQKCFNVIAERKELSVLTDISFTTRTSSPRKQAKGSPDSSCFPACTGRSEIAENSRVDKKEKISAFGEMFEEYH